MQIIIVGCGKVGSTIAEQLSVEGHDIVIVDTDEEVVKALATRLDLMGVTGNGATHSILEEAGVATVTGEAFGDKKCIRLSYAASEEALTEAIRRIKASLS